MIVDSALPPDATIRDFEMALAADVPGDRRLRIFAALPRARREAMWTALAASRAVARR